MGGPKPFKNCKLYDIGPTYGSPKPFKDNLGDNSISVPSAPDPHNFKILNYAEIGNYLLVKLRYPDCTNYEGLKICLFENVGYLVLLGSNSLDPHFSPTNDITPIARFEPTEEGWNMGLKLARQLNKESG